MLSLLPAVADLISERVSLEVVVGGSSDGNVYCIDNTGGLVWRCNVGGIDNSSPAIVDLDGDGNLEVLVGSNDEKLHCVDKDGQIFVPSDPQGSIDPVPWLMFHHDLRHTGYYER